MARKPIGAVLTLKDNFTATLRGVRKEQSQFRKDVQETRKALEKSYKKKYDLRVNHTAAAKKIKELRKDLEPLRKKVVTALAYKDMISRRIRETRNNLRTLGRMTIAPVIKVKDMATRQISRIKGALGAIAMSPIGIAAGAALGAASVAGVGSLSAGAQLEQQQVSMEHFIGINNKGKSAAEVKKMRDDYLNQLRENANATPFETSAVIASGTRALGVAGGNTAEAMELVKVAEDMAALTPGKTVQDAMEALADAKNGEMERLKEFNAKVSAEEFKKLGFKGIVDQRLKSQFEGGSAKLAESGSGLWSTIKGKLGSKAADTGLKMLEQLKPTLQSAISLIDQYSPKMDKIGSAIGSGVGKGIQYVGKFVGFVKEHMPQIKAVGAWVAENLSSAFKLIGNGVRLVYNIFRFAWPGIKAVILTVWDVIRPVLVKLRDLIGWVGDKAGKIADWLGKKVAEREGTGVGSVGKNAIGTSYWRGGPTMVNERGGEIIDLPRGSRIYPHDKSVQMAKSGGQRPIIINIHGTGKSTDQIVNEMVPKLKLALNNM